LAVGGKFQNDFRVTGWGRVFRRLWLDELPMLLNWVKGDLKLVGVRPLSQHYASLYPRSLLAYRSGFKPGLVPPFYADLPGTFDEILESEEAYLRSFEQQPVITDVRYLFRAAYNIVFRHARSQ
jgi:lipopolysaccharide/colanic/teichoic acid biosynthesis glycosyltransferase